MEATRTQRVWVVSWDERGERERATVVMTPAEAEALARSVDTSPAANLEMTETDLPIPRDFQDFWSVWNVIYGPGAEGLSGREAIDAALDRQRTVYGQIPGNEPSKED